MLINIDQGGLRGCNMVNRACPSRCKAQCKTWARDPMQDLGAGPH